MMNYDTIEEGNEDHHDHDSNAQDDDNNDVDSQPDHDDTRDKTPEYEGPSILDRLREYWTDFMNNTEDSAMWKFFFSENWYYRLKRNAVWFADQASIRFTFEDLMLMMTIFVIFGGNIELATLPVYADGPFAVAIAICMFMFSFELLLNTWSKSKVKVRFSPKFKFKFSGYIFSFHWFFDLIAIVSLWPDIPWISPPLHSEGLSSSAVQGSQSYTNAGRVVRLVRLVRFIRLYRLAAERRRALKQEQYLQELVDKGDMEYSAAQKWRRLNNERQSKLGSKLSKVVIHYVIIIVLIMLVIIPVLDYNHPDSSDQFALDFIHSATSNPTLNNASKSALINIYIDAFTGGSIINNPQSVLVYLDVSPQYGIIVDDQYRIENLRRGTKTDLTINSIDDVTGTTYHTRSIYDDHLVLYKSSQFAIYLTICVAFVLIGGYITFTKDVKRLVIKPIERMMNMVEIVAQDPLQPLEDAKVGLIQQGKYRQIMGTATKVKSGQYETMILEQSLEKVTGLLRVGFGEAGAGIIRSNLNIQSLSSTSKAVINALLPGVRIYAIFGFCDIHHFEEINKALSNEVLTFVNTIADIVHGSVHTWGGQCNKNLGNAFVLVWRISDEESLAQALQSTAIAIKGVTSPTAISNKFEANSVSGVTKPRSASRGNRDSEGRTTRGLSNGVPFGSENDDANAIRLSEHLNEEPRSRSNTNLNGEAPSISDSESNSASASAISERTSKSVRSKKAFKIDIRKIPGVDILADGALISYLKIIAEINRSSSILRYRQEPRLQFHKKGDSGASSPIILPKTPRVMSPVDMMSPASSSNMFNPNTYDPDQFKVRMGFGLHAGWGIEGAVGSTYKVDATYLSPHVNMAARLETASKQYKVPVLMSHIFHELLSDIVRTKTRQIDTVTVKGSDVPIGVFTYDCLQEQEFTKRTKTDIQLYAGISRRKADSQNSTSTQTALESQLESTEQSVHNQPVKRTSGDSIPTRRPSLVSVEDNVIMSNEEADHMMNFALQSGRKASPSNPPAMIRPRVSSNAPSVAWTPDSAASVGSPTAILGSSKKIVITNLPRNSPSMRSSLMISKPDVKRQSFIITEEMKARSSLPVFERYNHNISPSGVGSSSMIHPNLLSLGSSSTMNDSVSPSSSYPDISSFSSPTFTSDANLPPPPPPSSILSSVARSSMSDMVGQSPDGISPPTTRERRKSGVTYNLIPTVINIDDNGHSSQYHDSNDSSNISNRQLSLDYPMNGSPMNGSPMNGQNAGHTPLNQSPFKPIDSPYDSPSVASSSTVSALKKKSPLSRLFTEIHEPPVFSSLPITTIMASTDTVQDYKLSTSAKLPGLSMPQASNPASNASSISLPSSPDCLTSLDNMLNSNFFTPSDSIEEIIDHDTDIVKLRKHITPEFMETFQEGFKFYSQGDWPRARVYFERSDDLMKIAAPVLGGDGPSQTLLNYMRSLGYKSPKGWNGYRALTNK